MWDRPLNKHQEQNTTQIRAPAKGSSLARPRASLPGLCPTRKDPTLLSKSRLFRPQTKSQRESLRHPTGGTQGAIGSLCLLWGSECRLLHESWESRRGFPVDTVCYTQISQPGPAPGGSSGNGITGKEPKGAGTQKRNHSRVCKADPNLPGVEG